ncbi:outer membrane beta-barrel protein [Cytophagaceae bacterium DM2B3-1]|uniref:Outer membrane beta-barrel protein n=1 Tax=Xanthocytophaga flava TaxID=3048013 RepID=A0ABT7CS18_9BACT|nr:outer membrane beta-barrel protein [Xanthocytophaga flavus]MDJ1495444.1 outer membrane beta-barrel protein [Xanthocytophaga flavus]
MNAQHKLYLLCTSLVLTLITFSAQAQNLQLTGLLSDQKDHSPLIGATVMLTPQTDTTKKVYILTDVEGRFTFGSLSNQTYILSVSYLGYEPFKQAISVSSAKQDMGTLQINPKTTQLNEVQIRAKRYEERTVQKGDTTEYNAGAFKTNRDANAEDLVTKMPGVTMENGTVKAQGEDVKKVLVDGKEFFGDDATLALRNLPAEVIDKIQVFDRMSEQSQFTGFDDGQSVKTINIVTRADKRNGQFGKIYAGYGTDDRYQAGGNLNIFKGNNRISILGLSNNINQQNFATQDLVGAFSGGGNQRGGGGNRGGGGGGQGGGGNNASNNFLVGQQSGISTTNSLGLNYSGNWGKKVTINGSYFFNKANTQNQTLLNREYFIDADSSQYYNTNTFSGNTNWNHRFNLRLEYKIDSANSIVFTPRLSFQTNNSISNTLGRTQLSDGNLLNDITNTYNSDRKGYTIGNEILYRHRFTKQGRTFSFGINTSWNKNDGNNRLYSLAQYYTNEITTQETTDQISISNTDGYTLSGNVVYTEPLSRKSQLQFNYNSSFTQSNALKETYDYDENTDSHNKLNPTLSNTFDNQNYVNRASVGYRINDKKLNMMANVGFQKADLIGNQLFPITNKINRSFYNALPSLMLNYKFTTSRNIRIFYRTSTNLPSITQLQNVINNNNPLLLTGGNPNLRQEFVHSFMARYSAAQPTKGRTLLAMLSLTRTNNNIGNSTFIATKDSVLTQDITLKKGAQLSTPVNLNGSWSTRSLFTYGLPVGFMKSNLNLTSSVTYNNTPALINTVTNTSNSYTLSQGLTLSSNISEKIDFTLGYTGNYNIVRNTLQPQLNNNYFYHLANGKLNWTFGKGFVLQNNVSYTQYFGLEGGYNQSYVLWNASFAKKFFKDQNGELKLSVFDLLNQNNNISRNVTETYIEDSQTQVLKQYFMLTFTYTLRSFGKK